MFKQKNNMYSQPIQTNKPAKKERTPSQPKNQTAYSQYEITRLELMLKVSNYTLEDMKKFFSSINVEKEARKILSKIHKERGE
jgi:hypothetical protein